MALWNVQRFSSHDELAREAAKQWLDWIQRAKARDPILSVVLTGGRIASRMLMEAAAESAARKISWGGVQFFWGDERCVPPDDPESNFHSANEEFLQPLEIEPRQVHRICGEAPPDEAARLASEDLLQVAQLRKEGVPVLDHVLLGMGEDGHIASLFPGALVEVVQSREVFIPVIGPKPPPKRISLTYGVLAAAREVWVIASGEGKSAALEAALSGPKNPLGQLLTMRSNTQIFTDILG